MAVPWADYGLFEFAFLLRRVGGWLINRLDARWHCINTAIALVLVLGGSN